MAAPTGPVPRRTRWVQGLIIAASAVVIIFALATIVGRAAKPTDETSPSVVPSVQTVFPESSEPSVATVEPALVEQPAPTEQPAAVEAPVPTEQPAPVEQPAAVEAPVPTTAATVVVSYENCRAVWDAIGRPIAAGEPGYDEKLDNHNGLGCEQQPS